MKSFLTLIGTAALLATLAWAQPPRYNLKDLGPLGPPPGEPYFVAGNGLVAGAAATSGGAEHAVLWYRGQKLDLATIGLGGPNSQAFGVNDRGQAVGEAQTSVANAEDFCGFNAMGFPASSTACAAFVWQNGMMTKLPTLGGANAVANLINNRGEVVGLAENHTAQPGCSPVTNQFKPVIWRNGGVQQLPTVGGDPDGGVFGINDNGQAVGATGGCAAPFNPNSQVYLFEAHAVLWENGEVHDLGNLGGDGGFAGNHACSINNRGQVVGHSDVTGDTTAYAFLWTGETGMQSLHALTGDFASFATSINNRDQVVGTSVDATFSVFRAFLWQNGVMTDLNALVPDKSPFATLQFATSIDANGEIVGFGQTAGGEVRGFLATPTDGGDSGESVAPVEVGRVVSSESARRLLVQRLGIRRE